MSIAETQKIDIVATKPGDSVVQLVITDHLGWDDFHAHSLLLQEKVNTYLAFVESGQLGRMREHNVGPDSTIRIVLAAQRMPSDEARDFLARVGEFLESAGYEFEVRIG